MPPETSIRVSIDIPISTIEQLEEYANDHEQTRAQAMRSIIKLYLTKLYKESLNANQK